MLTVRTVAELRAWRPEGSIGLVPTMGAFHEGHLSLIDAARAQNDHVVVWLFVNPTQFNESADLDAYPRDEARDAALAAEHGADVLFAPGPDEVYPPGFATTVNVAGLGDTLEGAHRPGHFAGVATVVSQDAEHGAAAPRLLRRKRRSAGRARAPAGDRPGHPDGDRDPADRP